MKDTSKEVKLLKRMANELTYASEKLFEAMKGLNGIYDAEVSSYFCLDHLLQPFSRSYYHDTDEFLRDFDKLKDLSFDARSLLSKLQGAMSARATDFNHRIVKLTEEEE